MAEGVNFGLVDQNAFYKGASNMNSFLQSMALQNAGKQMAAGDTSGAVKTIQSSGNIAGAQQVSEDSWKNDDRIKALDDRGRLEHATRINKAATMLQSVKANGGDPVTAFEQLAPELKANGTTDEELASVRAQLAQNPDNFLNALATKTDAEMKMYSLPPGTRLADHTGKIVASAPFAPQTKIVTDGNGTQHLIQINADGTDGPEVPGGANAAPAKPVGAPITSAEFAANLQNAAPGAIITSGKRSAADNARVGGVPNSNHLTDNAADVVPGNGMSMAELNSRMQAQGYHTVPERGNKQVPPAQADHIHVDFNGRHPGQMAAAPQAVPSFGPGVRELYTGTPKPQVTGTPSYRSPAEVAALGYPAGTVVQTDAKGVDHVTYKPTATSGAGGKSMKLTPQDGAYLNKVKAERDEYAKIIPKLDQFIALNKQVETGGALAVPGAADILSPFNPKLSNLRRLTQDLVPNMRQGLPGAASERDTARFEAATVGVDKPFATNKAVVEAARALAKRQSDRLSFYEAFAKANGNLLGADELWASYMDQAPLFSDTLGNNQLIRVLPYKDWRSVLPKDLSMNGGAEAEAAPKVRKYNPLTGRIE